ncbi:tryptophan--tRNA ligase [Leekyejoonella antrihumi]|uniref:Tryptophan--tRNA ligase n=2 Tax=Leekyejoonella antrihumi TaxID=1660198 RepID=A0A563E7A4_9MICO|nr:tryptophan--tRNA ligase [Leekyejoonella antrihumi]
MSTDPSFDAAASRSVLLHELIDDPESSGRVKLRVLTGDRPTGPLHIGHYLASLRSRVELQDKGIESLVLVADYQVITDRDSVGAIQDNVMGCVLDYLAAGIDPEQSTIFTHSAVPALNQLLLPFLSLVTDSELRRNPTVKDELAATDGRPLSGLLLTYPVHQAADILFCHANVVPIGRDNLPHVEQTRLIARRFNRRYAGGQEVFREPDALLSDAPLVLGLDGQKMSKSRGNSVTLAATADETAALIRKARTDSERRITFEPGRRPEVSSMLTTAALFRGESPQQIAEQVGDGGAAQLKKVVIEAVNEGLAGHRRRRAELAADQAYLRDVLRAGNARADEIAEATLATVRQVMQMTY